MASIPADFVEYCCELLGSVGRCQAKRMFGGYGLSVDGRGDGPRLWLKANANTRAEFESAGCARFTYTQRGKERSMDYYSAPDEAMESAVQMRPWAERGWRAALEANAR